jgi:AraC-like DNA-binding protein
MELIAVMLTRQDERHLLSRVLGNSRLRFGTSLSQLVELVVNDGRYRTIVSDTRDVLGVGLSRVLAQYRAKVNQQLIVYTSLVPAAAREVIELSRLGFAFTVRLRGYDPFERLAKELDGDPTIGDATSTIVRVATAGAEDSVREILAAAMILGERRCQVGAVARVCGLSQRTIERRLESAHLPPVWRLLGWSLVLNAAWRLDVLGWPVKRAAAVAGFANRETFATFFSRHTGYAIGEFRSHQGFDAQLSAFEATLRIPRVDYAPATAPASLSVP